MRENIFELIGNLDDELVEKSLNIDCEIKLKKAKKEGIFMKKNILKMMLPIGMGVACVAILCVGLIMGNMDNKGMHIGEKEMVQVVNPIMEVESTKEMEKYLGLKVPQIGSQKESAHKLYIIDSYASLGRVDYENGDTLSIAEEMDNINGIYGGELEKTEKINGIDVNFYSRENMKYIELNYDGVSIGYSSEAAETFEGYVNKLINSIKN